MKMLEGIDQIYEYVPLQQVMLFHTLYTPESSVHNIKLEFALEGDLEEGTLERAWCSLVPWAILERLYMEMDKTYRFCSLDSRGVLFRTGELEGKQLGYAPRRRTGLGVPVHPRRGDHSGSRASFLNMGQVLSAASG